MNDDEDDSHFSIEFSEQEAKDFKKVPIIDEEETVENKELSTRLFKEQTTKYAIPTEIENALVDTLKLNPLIRFVKNLKAVNSIPPSYRVFLLNGEFFDVYYESFSLLIKIGSKEYFVGDLDERNYAIKHINKLPKWYLPGFISAVLLFAITTP